MPAGYGHIRYAADDASSEPNRMIDALRELPVLFFVVVNPILWLFLLNPAILFWFYRDQHGSGDLLLVALQSVLVGWVLAVAHVFGTDWFVWQLADARGSIPEDWKSYLYGDGARDVFVLILGWAYALIPLALWSPVIAVARISRRKRKSPSSSTA
jgi:hypothetical protein